MVAGVEHTLRPTFTALVAAEEELGPLFALVERAGAGQLKLSEMAALIPFAKTISDLEDSRRRLESVDGSKMAATLEELARSISALPRAVDSSAKPKRTVAARAARWRRTVEVLSGRPGRRPSPYRS